MNTALMAKLRAALAACWLGLWGVEALAQPETDSARLEALVAALDSDSFSEREFAAIELQSSKHVSRSTVSEMLSRPGLSLEQRMRLETIALRIFENEPRAALGVGRGMEDGPFGIPIARTIEGFDAAEVLQVGDRIIGVEGRPIRNWRDLTIDIASHSPGETLPLTVMRGDEQLELAPVLGRRANLEQVEPLGLWELLTAWQRWSERQGVGLYDEPTITVQVDANSVWGIDLPRPGRLTAGGSVRTIDSFAGVSGARGLVNNNPNVRVRVFRDGQIIEVNPEVPAGAQVLVRDPRQAQIQAIDDEVTILKLRLRILRQTADVIDDPERRDAVQQEIAETEARIEGFMKRRIDLGGR